MGFRGWQIAVLCLVAAGPGSSFAQDKFFDSNGVRVHYTERGSGDVIVLIHGNGGSLQRWIDSGVLPDLARNCYFTFEKESGGSAVWPFDDPQYVILNLAIGGGWGGQKGIDDSSFPARFLVDYVRVYQ